MSLAHAILAILNVTPMTGYDLKHTAFDASVAHFWPADQSQIYRTLDRLARDGYATFVVEDDGPPPHRKVYSITEAGQAKLREWLTQDDPLPTHRDPFLIRLFFAYQLSNEEIAALLDGQEAHHRARLEALQSIPMPPQAESPEDRWRALRRLTLDLGLRLETAYLEWLEHCRAVLEDLPEDGDIDMPSV